MSTHAAPKTASPAPVAPAPIAASGPRLQVDKNDVLLCVRVKPRGRANALEGARGNSLLITVFAAPCDGEANAAVIEVLARALEMPKSQVSIARGASSRDKTIRLSGISLPEAQARLEDCASSH